MSKISIESTISTALRVAAEVYDRKAQEVQALPLARAAFEQSAEEAREMLDQLEAGALRIVQGSGAVTDKQRLALLVAALREAHATYHQHANDEQLPPRIRAQFERQAAEARVVCSRLEVGRLHVVQGLKAVQASKE